MTQISIFLLILLSLSFSLSQVKRRWNFSAIFSVSLVATALISHAISTYPSNFSLRISEYMRGLFPNSLSEIIATLAVLFIIYGSQSLVIVDEGYGVIVERLGRYNRRLLPGLNFIIPIIETGTITASLKERVMDVEPVSAVTRDSIPVRIELVVFWRIYDLEKTFYAANNAEVAITEMTRANLLKGVGTKYFEELFTSQEDITLGMIDALDEATAPWGIKVNRTEISNISFSPAIREKMDERAAAQIEKSIEISKAQARVEELKLEREAFDSFSNGHQSMMAYLLIKRQIEASNQIAKSNNAKLIYMDSKVPMHIIDDFLEAFTQDKSSSS